MFNVSNLMPCPGETVTFTVTNPMAGAIYKWDLDGVGGFNNGTGTTQTFIYPYSASAVNFTVRLEKDGATCPGSQMVMVKAGLQPTLYVNSGQGQPSGGIIKICGSGQSNEVKVSNNTPVGNPSSTNYSIQWETNGPTEPFPAIPPTATVAHTYTTAGYHNITLTATLPNGCILINHYQCYKGGTPNGGLESDSFPSVLCAPHPLLFRVTNYQNNPPGTTYVFTKNGQPVSATYLQETLPNPFTFTYNFTESTCGQTTPNATGGMYQNATAIHLNIKNPCDEKSINVSPIRVVTKPVPDFSIQHPLHDCPNEVFTFTNTSTNIHEIVNFNDPCVDILNADWAISGNIGTDWTIVSGTLLGDQTIKIKFLKPGIYTITMTLNPTPTCGPAVISKTITILEPPDALATTELNPNNGCAPLTVKFKNNSTGYQVSHNWHISPGSGWSWQPPDSGTGDVSTKEPTAIFVNPGTYTVTLTVSNVCSTDTWTEQIVVKGKPTVTLPTLGPFCKEATLNFTAPAAPTYGSGNGTITSYAWSFPGGTPSSSTSPNPTGIVYGPVTVATSYTYTVSVTNECGTTPASKTFEIQVPATISLPPDMTVCANAPAFQITPVTPANGTWSGNPGVTPGGLFTPANASGPGVKTLTYTYGAAGSACTATKTMKITIVALPTVNAGLDLKKCVSDPVFALSGSPAPPPGTGTWASSPTTPGLSGSNFNPTTSGAGMFTLTYTYTDANGCKNSDPMTVTVHALPVISASNATFCHLPGKVPMPPATPPGGTWSGTGVMGNEFDPIAAGIGTHTATYTYMDPQTTCSNSKSITITVGPPENINAGPDKTFCKNDPLYNLDSDATNSVNGNWSGPGVSGNFFDPAAVVGPGPFTVKLEKGADNCKVTDERMMTVNPIPVVTVPAVAKSCIDETDVLLPPTTPATGGNWTSVPAGLVTGNTFNAASAGEGDFTLTYTFTDTNLCTNSAALIMTVHPLPEIKVGDTVYCNTPGAINLPFATPPGGTWTGPGISNNQFDPISAGGIGNYTATYSFTNMSTGCGNKKNINIEVISPDNIDAGPDKVFCLNDAPFNLDSDATNSVNGNWSGPGVSGNTFTPAAAGAGTHTIVLKKGPGNCQVVDERIFKVNPLPDVDVPATAKSCVSETAVNLPATTPATGGTWTSVPPGLVSGTVFNAKMAGQGNFTLTYTFTDQQTRCTNSDSLIMTVHPLPTVMVPDATFCNTPGTVPLPAAIPPGGTWSGTGVSGDEFDPKGAGGIGVYPTIYTFTDSNGCTNRDTARIEVIAPENINAGADSVFCLNDPPFDLDSDATNSANGTWSGPGVTGNLFSPASAGAGTHTIVLKKGVDNCEVVDEREMTVNPLPKVEVPLTEKSCVSETAVVLPLTIPATGGIWTSVPPGLVTGTVFNPTLAGEGDFVLTHSFTDTLGCTNRDSLLFTVYPLPMPMSHDTTFCNTPGLVTMPTAEPSAGSMGWWTGAGVFGFQFDPQGAGGVGVYPATYHFTDTHGCTDSVTVSIDVIEPVQPDAGANDTICIDDGLLQLTGFFPDTGGHWSGPGITNTATGLFDPQLAGGGAHELDYAYGAGNCELHDKKKVLVIAVAIEAGPDRAVCLADNPFALTGFSPATGGTWIGTGITNPATGAFSPAVAGVGEHVLLYEFKDAILGCTFRDSLKMRVNPMPESDFPQPTTTCVNEPVFFKNLSKSTYDVLWDFGDGSTSTKPEPMHTYTSAGTFTVKLVTKNEFGCTDMASRTIFVTEPPSAHFTLSPDMGCAVLMVDFENQSAGFQPSFLWKFGNFKSDTLQNPGAVEFPGGTKDTTYYITLEVKNLCATRTWNDSVLVHPLPIAIFGTETDTICSGDILAFTNISLGQGEIFEWDFGNGNTSTDSLPLPQQYFVEVDTFPKTYTIRLIARNVCGADTAYHQITVNPLDVSAFFNVPNYTGCQPYTVQFTNFATPGAKVFWDFGDGNTSSDFNPMHTFLTPGVFKVVQKASDGCGYDSTFAFITVLPAPDVSFDCLPQICRNDTLQFTNTSPSALSGVRWDFGDGDTSVLNNPSHAYGIAGVKTVALVGISAENGCPAPFSRDIVVLELPDIHFLTDKTNGCVPLTVAFQSQSQDSVYYEWGFGDGNTQSGPAPQHTYYADGQYEVRLRAIDLKGCRNDTLLRYITVYPIPSPDFEIVREHLCGVPVEVLFKNKTPDAVSFEWHFGDGSSPSPLNDPIHSYGAAGDFMVELIAKNSFGCVDTTDQVFSAYAQPLADFAWSPGKGCSPLTVLFENLSSNTTSAHWLFSDGGTSDSLVQAYHTFYQPGKHGTTLVVSHREVCFDTLELSGIIDVLPSPTANFSFMEILTSPPSGMLEFTDLSIGAAKWLWDFADGDSSEIQNPHHRFFSNGPKLVKLTVWGINGCPDDTVQSVTPARMRGLFIPDAFTPGLPNGDASKFLPKGVGLHAYHIAVYSSYGTLLWQSEALSDGSPAEFWDGTFEGQPMAPDVYTWKLINVVFDDGTVFDGQRVGSVTLIR
ncbi:MAG: PKD domain-containing protein [Saprospiraceae bacterium]